MLKEFYSNRYHYFEDEHGWFQGEYKSWYKNGIMKTHCFYINNERSGEFKYWHENGQIDMHCFYNDGYLIGEYKEWGRDGSVWAHCFYIDHKVVSFDKIPYPKTDEERMYFTLKYGVPLLPREVTC